jgi:hypothetical protein
MELFVERERTGSGVAVWARAILLRHRAGGEALIVEATAHKLAHVD